MKKVRKDGTQKISAGPFVTCAAICEQVIEGKDNVLSAIRFIDTITLIPFQTGPTIEPSQGRAGLANLLDFTFLVSLKSGDYQGRGKLRIDIKTPTDRPVPSKELEIDLAGGHAGHNVVLRGNIAPPENGLYWFEVYFDNRLLTRSPLNVRIGSGSPTTKNDQRSASQADTQ